MERGLRAKLPIYDDWCVDPFLIELRSIMVYMSIAYKQHPELREVILNHLFRWFL